MDEFVVQVDIAHEIINVVSMLMQLGHFNYRKSEKNLQGISCESEDYLEILCEVGSELKRIFGDSPKQRCKLKASSQHILSNIVINNTNEKLSVFAYRDKTQIPNIIMLLYVNHGYYPE